MALTTEDDFFDKILKDINDPYWNVESDKTELALFYASKLENHSVQELLQNADKILNWMLKEKAPR